MLSILATFWLILAGLLNERVEFNGNALRPYDFDSCVTQKDVYPFSNKSGYYGRKCYNEF